MSLISIRLTDSLLHETKAKAETLHLSQTEYIRKAIEHMNDEISRQERKEQLQQASFRVRNQSRRINHEFSQIEHDPED
jgi:Arc/MetJ-type ribon-helix-helix transcriptional regulator